MADIVSTGLSARPAGWIPAGRLRLAIFLAIAAFMVAGPLAEQIFGARTTVLRSWEMFSGIGLGVIDASFTIRQPGGTFVPLDRFEMLGEPRTGKMKRIEKSDELTLIITRLCAAAGPGADIRVKARQARRSGWQVLGTDRLNVCGE